MPPEASSVSLPAYLCYSVTLKTEMTMMKKWILMVAFVLALYLFQYAARRHCRPYMRTLYWLIGLASAWTVIKFFESSLDYGFTEAITISFKPPSSVPYC